VQVLVKLLTVMFPLHLLPPSFISYVLLAQLVVVTVAVIVHVSLPVIDTVSDEEHNVVPPPDEPLLGEPLPPPPPPPTGVGVNTLNADLKNDTIELKNDEKKLVTS
jgi:hypothetical protein